ncbi:MAG: hypothetical protein OHK0011_16530 [Turneriella sp.]
MKWLRVSKRVDCLRLLLVNLLFLVSTGLSADFFDEPAQPKPPVRSVFFGAELAATGHSEAGLDRSKGEYSVSYSTLGGSATAEYHLSEFYFHGGIGLMRLMGLRVNGQSQNMENRVQWHVPLYAHAFYRLDKLVALGTGLTHLTETTMYLNDQPVPESSYNHLFVDAALQLRPRLGENLTAVITGVIGLNVIPGRQHTYSVGDLLHLRFQLMAGIVYAAF